MLLPRVQGRFGLHPSLNAHGSATLPAPLPSLALAPSPTTHMSLVHVFCPSCALWATCAAIMGSDPAEQLRGAQAVRRLLSRERDPPAREVVAAGLLPRMVQLLAEGTPKLQLEMAWSITNIASTAYVATSRVRCVGVGTVLHGCVLRASVLID
jgi:hypothetical protein